MESLKPLWWTLDDAKERAAVVRGTVDALERNQSERRLRILRNVSIFEGRKLEGLYPSAYFSSVELSGDQYDIMRLNLARNLVKTAMAKIAGKQRPKAQFVVTDADWSTKRKAKRLERFVEAVMMQRQGGQMSDGWDVHRASFRDCLIMDSGWVKYSVDKTEKRVVMERLLPWELYFDPYESRYGQPLNAFHVYGYDRDKLAAEHPKYRQEILDAPSLEEDTGGADTYGTGVEVSRMIKVREPWRLPISAEKPGRHSIIVGDVDLLGESGEEYTCPFFPFEGITFEPWVIGVLGASLIDDVANVCDELNAAVDRRSEAERLCSNQITYFQRGALVKPDDIEDNRLGIAIELNPNVPVPTTVTPDSTSAGSIQWAQELERWGHDMSGVSKSSATGTIDPGVTAGIAMRTKENIASERFAIPWQAVENLGAIRATRQIIACVRALAEDDPDFAVKWPGGDFLREIKWADVDLEDDQYIIQVQAVSGLVNTPADRLQLASELFDRGVIQQDAFLAIIQYKDISGELSRLDRQRALVEKYIELWSDATPELEEAALKRGKPLYRPPIKWMGAPGLTEAIVQVGHAFLEAEMNDAPDYNLEFFLRYMAECDRLITEIQGKQAALQGAATGNPAAMQAAGLAPPPMPQGQAPAPPMPPPGGMLQ